jgi:hypothetical protein
MTSHPGAPPTRPGSPADSWPARARRQRRSHVVVRSSLASPHSPRAYRDRPTHSANRQLRKVRRRTATTLIGSRLWRDGLSLALSVGHEHRHKLRPSALPLPSKDPERITWVLVATPLLRGCARPDTRPTASAAGGRRTSRSARGRGRPPASRPPGRPRAGCPGRRRRGPGRRCRARPWSAGARSGS